MSTEEPRQLTNFIMRITEDVHVADDLRPRRAFRGTITLLGADHHFTIDAEDYGNNGKLTAAIYAAAGAKAEIDCKPEKLRTAISAVSGPAMRRASTNFGWNADKTAYMVPRRADYPDGFQAADQSAVQVDLADQEFAKRLSLRPIPTEQLAATKQHIVEDLLQALPGRQGRLFPLGGRGLVGALPLHGGHEPACCCGSRGCRATANRSWRSCSRTSSATSPSRARRR